MIIELEPRYAPLAQNEAGTSREMLVTGMHYLQLWTLLAREKVSVTDYV